MAPYVPSPGWYFGSGSADETDEQAAVAPLLESGVLPAQARWFSSPDADEIPLHGIEVEEVEGLRDAHRPLEITGEPEFIAAVTAYLRDGLIPDGADWETRVDVTLRIVDTTLAILATFPSEDVVLVGHGIAFTLLVAALTGSKPDAEAWRHLRAIDHCALGLLPEDSFEILSSWGVWDHSADSSQRSPDTPGNEGLERNSTSQGLACPATGVSAD